MARKDKPIRSDIAWSTHDRIEVRGKSLPDELLGKINLGDMAFLQILGRMPTAQESNLFNAICVALVEHGITPSSLAARLTYAGGIPRARPDRAGTGPPATQAGRPPGAAPVPARQGQRLLRRLHPP